MEASADALEEFLVGFPCRGEDVLVVVGVAADEAVVGDIFVEGAWVDIRPGNSGGSPDLAGDVAGLGGPISGRHHGLFAVEKDEALWDIGVFVLRFVWSCSGEDANSNTGLGPVSFGAFVGGVVCGEPEVHFVAGCGDDMLDRDTIFQGAKEFNFRAIFGCGDQFCGMANNGMFHPVCGLRIGPAIGFEIMNPHCPRQWAAVYVEPVLFPTECQGSGSEGESEE